MDSISVHRNFIITIVFFSFVTEIYVFLNLGVLVVHIFNAVFGVRKEGLFPAAALLGNSIEMTQFFNVEILAGKIYVSNGLVDDLWKLLRILYHVMGNKFRIVLILHY